MVFNLTNVVRLSFLGYGKLASVPSGGAVAVAASAGSGGGAAAPAAGQLISNIKHINRQYAHTAAISIQSGYNYCGRELIHQHAIKVVVTRSISKQTCRKEVEHLDEC